GDHWTTITIPRGASARFNQQVWGKRHYHTPQDERVMLGVNGAQGGEANEGGGSQNEAERPRLARGGGVVGPLLQDRAGAVRGGGHLHRRPCPGPPQAGP